MSLSETFWMGALGWTGLVLLILTGVWCTLWVVDRRLKKAQARREALAVSQAQEALQKWREARSKD